MKKIGILFVIVLINIVFTPCTYLDENREKDPTKLEILASGGEVGYDLDEK